MKNPPYFHVLPLTREWIEMPFHVITPEVSLTVLPLTREWIEIRYQLVVSSERLGSPSYEGVD